MKVLFRVDGSPEVGLGHLMRCLALAQSLELCGIESAFAVRSSSVPLCKARHDWVGDIIIVPDSLTLQDEPYWLAECVRSNRANCLVIDSYQFDLAYRQAVYLIPVAHVCFDDTNSLLRIPTDLIINGAKGAEKLGYETTAADARLCIGASYRVLRNEFLSQTTVPWGERTSLTICMGGSDPGNFTLPLLAALENKGFEAPISLVTGAAFANLDALNSFLGSTVLNVEHKHDCQEMAALFSHSRLCVSAAGGTQFELMACACPSVLLIIADNQNIATMEAMKQNWCIAMNAIEGLDFGLLTEKVMELWDEEKLLQKMSVNAAQFADLKGGKRLASAIIDLVDRKNYGA